MAIEPQIKARKFNTSFKESSTNDVTQYWTPDIQFFSTIDIDPSPYGLEVIYGRSLKTWLIDETATSLKTDEYDYW